MYGDGHNIDVESEYFVGEDLPEGMTYKIPPFRALGDTTRWLLVLRLGAGPTNVGRLAEGLSVSRPAVSQHLKILKDAGLIREHREGRNRLYELDPEGIDLLRHWLDRLKGWAIANSGRDRSKSNTGK